MKRYSEIIEYLNTLKEAEVEEIEYAEKLQKEFLLSLSQALAFISVWTINEEINK